MRSPTNAPRSQVARKAALTRKHRAAGQKAARTRKRRAAGRKATASPLMKTMSPQEWNWVRRVLADFPKLSVVNALAALREAGI